jgi:hypothetical protein
MTIMNLLSWRVPVSSPLQRWVARQSRVTRFLVGLAAFAVTMLALSLMAPGWVTLQVPALVGGAIGFAAMCAWMPPR